MNPISFDDDLRNFDYEERKAMTIQLPELLERYARGEVQLIDIRFEEEYTARSVALGRHIPLNELPARLGGNWVPARTSCPGGRIMIVPRSPVSI